MIPRLRAAIFFTLCAVLLVLFWPISMLAIPLPAITRSKVIGGFAHAVVFLLRAVCGLSHKVEGAEHLPTTPSVIFSKHQSAWETFAFQTIFPPQAWVLKRSLLWIPLFGWGLAATRPIAIDRASARKALQQVVSQGQEVLKHGRWVVLFPEGTRTAPGEHGKFNASGALLASRANVPLIPVAHNAGDFWRRREFAKRPGTITVRIGAPLIPEGKKTRELNQQAEDWIRATMPQISEAYASPTK